MKVYVVAISWKCVEMDCWVFKSLKDAQAKYDEMNPDVENYDAADIIETEVK